MSIKIVKEEIVRFLASDFPEVLAIRGKWGIGKTYAWKKMLKEQKELNQIKLQHYSYVSLFGVNSLQDFKEILFQNMVGNDLIGKKLDIYTCASYLKDSLKSVGRKSARIVSQYISALSTYTNSLSSIINFISFVMIRNSIICIDDFERKGDQLTLKEILGLISQLKEERGCKIVLIYNEEYLAEEKTIYDELREKVIDIEIEYSPLSDESINIVYTEEDNIYQILSESSKQLGITNIRILIKIKRLALILEDVLSKYDSRILEQALKTLVLSCHVFYSKSEENPDFNWLKNYNITTSYMISEKDKDKKSKESKWCTFLQEYGYLNTDQFDIVIHNGVSNGYFNKEKLIAEAENLSNQYKLDHDNSYKMAWELFHKNLLNNKDDFIKAVYNGFLQNQQFLSVIDLNSTVITLRKLNRNDLVNSLVDSFLEARKNNIQTFDLSDCYYKSQKLDDYLKSKFDSFFEKEKKPNSLQNVINGIANNHSWSEDDKKYLDEISVADYYNYFKSLENPILRRSIHAILIVNIINAKAALINIAKESSYNALRLENYGIKLNV